MSLNWIHTFCHILSSKSYVNAENLGKQLKGIEWEKTIIPYGDTTYLLPAIYCGLKRFGLLGEIDPGVTAFIEAIHHLNIIRSNKITQQGIEVTKHLNAGGIQPILMKGLAGLVSGLYDEGERIMNDIDLLIDEHELETALQLMMDSGFRFYQSPSSDVPPMTYRHHAPGLVSDQWPVSVELHIRPTPLSGRKTMLDSESAREGAQLIEFSGAKAWLPSLRFRLLHNFFHSQFQDGKNFLFGRLHIRGLLDWIKLREQGDNEIDWAELYDTADTYHIAPAFSLYLYNANEYFGQPMPVEVPMPFIAKLHKSRQNLLLRSKPLASINEFTLWLLQNVWDFHSPLEGRKRYGDIPYRKALQRRYAGMLDHRWYQRRYLQLSDLLQRIK